MVSSNSLDPEDPCTIVPWRTKPSMFHFVGTDSHRLVSGEMSYVRCKRMRMPPVPALKRNRDQQWTTKKWIVSVPKASLGDLLRRRIYISCKGPKVTGSISNWKYRNVKVDFRNSLINICS